MRMDGKKNRMVAPNNKTKQYRDKITGEMYNFIGECTVDIDDDVFGESGVILQSHQTGKFQVVGGIHFLTSYDEISFTEAKR